MVWPRRTKKYKESLTRSERMSRYRTSDEQMQLGAAIWRWCYWDRARLVPELEYPFDRQEKEHLDFAVERANEALSNIALNKA